MKANKITPNFSVDNIKDTVSFYESVLGFKLVMAVPESQDGIEQQISKGKEYVYALVVKDNVELMFQRTDSFKKDVVLSKQTTIGASVSFYIEVEDVAEFYNKIKTKTAAITPLETAWYGMREFYIEDINGYVLGFAQKAE